MPSATVLANPQLSKKESSGRPFAAPAYNLSIGYLRAFITLLVVAHHAALAYIPFAPPPPASLTEIPRIWQAFPVVDSQRSAAFSLLTSFNDIFFMALMFFVSGLFVWNGLERKGAAHFLRDRALRLGFPFVGAALIVAPLAYYPTYIQSGASSGLAGYWHQWRALGNWPTGPAWFVWVLLVFDGVAAELFFLLPKWGASDGRLSSGANRHPIVFFLILLALSGLTYVPLAVAFNPFNWSSWGPFTFQTSRGLHYLIYFLMGIGIGAHGLDRGLLARDGNLARRWWLWCGGCLLAFGVATVVGLGAMTVHLGSRPWEIAGDSAFVLSCAASSFAFLGLFVRFASRRNRVFDSFSENAYGIYLVHYAFVSWLQLTLLKAHLSAVVKGSLVFAGASVLSWGTAALLRRIPQSRISQRSA